MDNTKVKLNVRLFQELAAAIAAGRGDAAAPAAGFIVIPITKTEAATVDALEKLPAEVVTPAYESQMFTILPGEAVAAPQPRPTRKVNHMEQRQVLFWRLGMSFAMLSLLASQPDSWARYAAIAMLSLGIWFPGPKG